MKIGHISKNLNKNVIFPFRHVIYYKNESFWYPYCHVFSEWGAAPNTQKCPFYWKMGIFRVRVHPPICTKYHDMDINVYHFYSALHVQKEKLHSYLVFLKYGQFKIFAIFYYLAYIVKKDINCASLWKVLQKMSFTKSSCICPYNQNNCSTYWNLKKVEIWPPLTGSSLVHRHQQ